MKQNRKNKFTIRYPKGLVYFCGMVLSLFGLVFFFDTPDPNNILMWVLYSILIIFFALAMVHCIFWEVQVVGNEMLYKPLFGGKKSFTFNDVAKIKIKRYRNGRTAVLYSETKKLFSVDLLCTNATLLMAKLQQRGIMIES